MRTLSRLWARFWMQYAGYRGGGRLATRLATVATPPYYGRRRLAALNRRGYFSPAARIAHRDVFFGEHVFIDDRVLIYQDRDGGAVKLSENVHLFRDTIIQTGQGGSVTIGAGTAIQPRCQFSAYVSPVHVGKDVQIAPNCAFYPYNHGMRDGELMRKQPLESRGGIKIEDDAWLGVGVIVLDGVKIGRGAVVGGGAVVISDVPDGAIAAGVPARVLRYRSNPR